jgi:hypothetical protein
MLIVLIRIFLKKKQMGFLRLYAKVDQLKCVVSMFVVVTGDGRTDMRSPLLGSLPKPCTDAHLAYHCSQLFRDLGPPSHLSHRLAGEQMRSACLKRRGSLL